MELRRVLYKKNGQLYITKLDEYFGEYFIKKWIRIWHFWKSYFECILVFENV